jgi:cobalamin biosynthesis protein CobD/CbiB
MSQPPQFPSESSAYPEASQATTVLVLGIIAIVACQLLGPIAWVMGNNELAAIDAGRRAPENRGTANAGRILGIISTVLLGLVVILIVLLVAGAFTFSAFDSFN